MFLRSCSFGRRGGQQPNKPKHELEFVEEGVCYLRRGRHIAWSDDAGTFMSNAVARLMPQYRESDLDFVQRLLTEEGLAWRFEQTDDGAGAVLFADTTQLTAVPEDPSSEADGGIRFHNVRAGEQQDTVQALRAQRSAASVQRLRLCSATTTRQSRWWGRVRRRACVMAAPLANLNPTMCQASTPTVTRPRRSGMPICRCRA